MARSILCCRNHEIKYLGIFAVIIGKTNQIDIFMNLRISIKLFKFHSLYGESFKLEIKIK